MRIIIGAGNTRTEGWISTQENELNLVDVTTWERRFEENSLSHILAEHVWEHLSIDEGVLAARHCYRFLKPGGLLRVAVPDGNFANAWYQNMVKVGGPGPTDHPAASHKVVFTYEVLRDVFVRAGFSVELLEYCDENHVFHYTYWNETDGKIGRSYRFDTRNSDRELGMVSIILDAKKPLLISDYDPA